MGATTVQTMWFRAGAEIGEIEPDDRAFTSHDVRNVVCRLGGET